MASEVISSALLMIATIIATVALINAVVPSIYGMSGSITSVTNSVNNQMKTDITFIYETSDGSNHVTAWVKNTGQTQIPLSNFNSTDLFFGASGTGMERPTLNGTSAPSWTYTMENSDGGKDWNKGETMRIDINTSDTPLTSGTDYTIRLTLYNGAYSEGDFTE